MSNASLALVGAENNTEAKNEIALMVGGKKKDSLTAADRIYYGVPESRGHIDADSSLNLIYNCYYISVLDEKLFGEVERAVNISIYEKFLLDFFYRRFMGYENHYFRAPQDEEHFNAYNRMAVESGHPEWVMKKEEPKVDTSNKADESSDKDKSEEPAETSEENKSDKPAESENAGKVDVLDADGNVIAEDCDSEASNKSKKDEEKQPKQEGKKEDSNKDKKKGESTPEKKNDAKDKKESDAQSSVIFTETDSNGKKFSVDKNRHNEFKEVNAPVIKRYPGVEKLVDACKKQNKLVCLRLKDPDTDKSYNGLIYATIFDRGVPGSAHSVHIDPAKIRNHYSFIRPAAIPNQVFPFECPMVSFDKYLDEYIATNGQLSPESARAVDDECMQNYKFLYHVMYSSIPEADLSYVATVLTPLFFEIDRSNLSIRFKAIDYTSKYSFTLYCAEDVGLGKYAKDNARFSGLKIEVRVASEKDIKFRAVGKHAQEFRDILFNNSLGAFDIKMSTNDAKTPEHDKKADPKKQEKKPEYKPKQEKQQKQEKKGPEVNPAEVVKSVEQEQKGAWDKKKEELKQQSVIQSTTKTPEEKAAEAKRAANFAEAMKNQQQEKQVIEASNAIH